MAARKSSRRQRRRGRFAFLYKLLSFVLILAAIVTGCIVFFRVDDIVVSGQERYTAQEIIAASGIEQGENLFLLNKYKVAVQIRTALPYISEVVIRRSLPDTLVISVSESTAAAIISDETDWWILDAGCKVLERGMGPVRDDLAIVTGVTPLLPAVGDRLSLSAAEEDKLGPLVALLGALSDRGLLQRVGAVDLSGASTLLLDYGGRFTVKLRLEENYGTLITALEAAVGSLGESETGEIDLTGQQGYFRPGAPPG